MKVPRRILLKLSGERLAGERGFGICSDALNAIAQQIREVHGMGLQLGVVIGGGNVIRGITAPPRAWTGAPRTTWACWRRVINALALQDALEKLGLATRVLSALEIKRSGGALHPAPRHPPPGEGARRDLRRRHRQSRTSRTDTAAALRAAEIDAEVILKATKVDGVYDADPALDPNATRYDQLSYDQAIQRNLRFMDQTAIALCRENSIPIVVFDMTTPGNIRKVVAGEKVGTRVE